MIKSWEIFSGPTVTKKEILLCREERLVRQREWIGEGFSSLIYFTLNIPGDIKQFPLAHKVFQEGLSVLHNCFCNKLQKEKVFCLKTGDEAILLLNEEAEIIKRKTVVIEEEHPLGRLFDIDVVDHNGSHVSRMDLGLNPRKCMLCNEKAKECARSRRHSISELQDVIAASLHSFFVHQASIQYARCVEEAMNNEVMTTPKPGLVDANNNGSHADMTVETFLSSSKALFPWFKRFFEDGARYDPQDVANMFYQLRLDGIEAEKTMYNVTNGINTHKGMIFSFAIICGALGCHFAQKLDIPERSSVLQTAAELGKRSIGVHKTKFGGQSKTFGARKEAATGFLTVTSVGYPNLLNYMNSGFNLNDASILSLLSLIAVTEDTNVLRRSTEETCIFLKNRAKNIVRIATKDNLHELTRRLDEECMKLNISPGGSADLLAISLFLWILKEKEMIRE